MSSITISRDITAKGDFKNITCYTPACGGPGNIDPRL